MPDRVIRDELLHSERYWSVSIEAQRLFVHLLLNVDDLARFSGKNFTMRSACFPGQGIDPEKLERILGELVDVDLVRVYMHDNERFIFIPRFKQRLRFKRSKYPAPPKEINDIPEEKTDLRQSQDMLESVSRPQKRREEKRREEHIPANAMVCDSGFEEFWRLYPRKKSKGSAERAWAKLKPNEQLIAVILDAVERAKTSAEWTKDQGQFIPYPATWLNARGWLDELTPAQPKVRVLV